MTERPNDVKTLRADGGDRLPQMTSPVGAGGRFVKSKDPEALGARRSRGTSAPVGSPFP